ncbi:MAG: hypothetical protein Q9174_006445, partial [Haloplaca sp. 1 TL-2023]
MVFQSTSSVDDLAIDLEYDALKNPFTMADAISIEEANKIRAAIGLKPLPVPGGGSGPSFKNHDDSDSYSEGEPASTLESRQAQGYENWKKLDDEQKAKAQREAKNEAIKKARDAARKFTQLKGKGLGDDAGEDLDTKTWLLQQKKRQRKIEREKARKLEEEMAGREQAPDHTAEDLAGVRVAHSLGDVGPGEQVYTLKDAGIDENEEEGDELENVDLKESEALQERLNVKKKKPLYDPHAEDGESPSILKHYDETIEGKKRKRFTLDGKGSTAEERESMRQSVGEKLKNQTISLDIIPDLPTSDYMEAKIKRPKKKPKSTRQKAVDEDDHSSIQQANGDQIVVDAANAQSKPKSEPEVSKDMVTFGNEDDLEAVLAVQRRQALKKRKRSRPEDIARQMREEAEEDSNKMDEDDAEGEGGLVIDETSEFVANLRKSPEPQKPRT